MDLGDLELVCLIWRSVRSTRSSVYWSLRRHLLEILAGDVPSFAEYSTVALFCLQIDFLFPMYNTFGPS